VKRGSSLGLLGLLLLTALSTAPAYGRGPGSCPASPMPLPTSEQRQFLVPERLLRCFLSAREVAVIRGARYHDAQTTVTGPQYESGELNPDGSLRPPLTADQTAALIEMHSILDQDMRAGAVLRKYVQNSDVGGYLYGRTVIGSPGSEVVVTTNTVRGFVGLERNTQGLDAGETVAALGLDYETASLGQFTDASPIPLHRQLATEVLVHGLHSIRHRMSAQGASDARIPLARDLNDAVGATAPGLDGRSFEMDRSGQDNPYTGLGISDNIGLLTEDPDDPAGTTYPLHLNEEDVMTAPTPLAGGDAILRRAPDGTEILIARYLRYTRPDGSRAFHWILSPHLSAADKSYYRGLIEQAAARVEAAGG
jgi:hypothetical protein